MSYLRTTIINKLNGNDRKIAPLFVAPPSSTDEEETDNVVELACGHIVRKKDDGEASSASFSINGIFASLSIFEATYCPMCEGEKLANKGFAR